MRMFREINGKNMVATITAALLLIVIIIIIVNYTLLPLIRIIMSKSTRQQQREVVVLRSDDGSNECATTRSTPPQQRTTKRQRPTKAQAQAQLEDTEYIKEEFSTGDDEPTSTKRKSTSSTSNSDSRTKRKKATTKPGSKYEFTRADIVECFQSLDHSKCGRLSVEDLVAACMDINEELVVEDIEDMLNEADSRGDMDGEVGVNDFISMARIVGLISNDG